MLYNKHLSLGLIVLCAGFARNAMAGYVAPKVAAGRGHCVVLRVDGTVWTWGTNNCAQLGDGTTIDKSTPVKTIGISEVKDVSAGSDFSVAVKQDGTVWAWGYNDEYGLLGEDSVNTERTSPVKVNTLTNINQVACGYQHTIALKDDGTVWAWGLNNQGQLGDGTSAWIRTSPVMLPGLSGVKSIVAGERHNFALKGDGTVWAWGSNKDGELGDGTTVDRNAPVLLKGLTGVKSIAAAGNHTVAVKNDGTVWTWGSNHYGELGDGTTENKITPKMLQGVTGAMSVGAGYCHTLVVYQDGTLAAFGTNSSGQLGNGATYDSNIPVAASIGDIKGVTGGGNFSLAVKKDGTLWLWGNNIYGQLGNGTQTQTSLPVRSCLPNIDMIVENFEMGNKSSYTSKDIYLSTGSWRLENAMIGTIELDKKFDKKSVRAKANANISMNFDLSNIKQVKIFHSNHGNDTGATWSLYKSIDGGSNWMLAGRPTYISSTLEPVVFSVSEKGKIRFKIVVTGNAGKRLNFDDITFVPVLKLDLSR